MSATKGMSTASVTGKAAGPKATPSVKGAASTKTPAVMSAKLPNGTEWAAHHDHQTLMDAEHIKADPVKMHKVRQVAGRKLMAATAINSIADIKSAAKNLRAGKLPGAGANPTEPGKRFPSGDMDPEGLEHHGTLERAEMIKASPSRMDGVRKVAAAKSAASQNVYKMVEGSRAEERGESAAEEKAEKE